MDIIIYFLAVFVVVGVAYNIWRMRQGQPKRSNKNVLFTQPSTIETQTSQPIEAHIEPIIDPSVAPTMHESTSEPASQPVNHADDSTLISVLVMSDSNGSYFPPYELLQALADVHCVFGEMGIFHRHEQETGAGKVLFSVAQAVNPGTFNMDDIGSVTCPGLMLFMDAAMMDNCHEVFGILLEAAQQLSEDLDATLYEAPGKPLTQIGLEGYVARLNHGRVQREKLKEMTP